MTRRKWLTVALAAVVLIGGTSMMGLHQYNVGKYGMVPPKTEMSERVGVTHADGKYHLTDEAFMLEGAKAVLELGSKVIKLWFTNTSKDLYSFGSDWSFKTPNMVELAKSPYYGCGVPHALFHIHPGGI